MARKKKDAAPSADTPTGIDWAAQWAAMGAKVERVPLGAVGLVTLTELDDEPELAAKCVGRIVRLALGADVTDEQAAAMEQFVRAHALGVKVVPRPRASATPERAHRQAMPAKSHRAVVLELLEDGGHRDNAELRELVIRVADEGGLA